MIAENQLEQLPLDGFRETGWEYANGVDISPDGDDPERDDYRVVVLKDRLAVADAWANQDRLQLGARCRHAGWRDCGVMIWKRRDDMPQKTSAPPRFKHLQWRAYQTTREV